MWILFKPLANLLDSSPDKSVDEYFKGKYNSALGVVGWTTLCLLVAVFFVCLTWWRGSIFKPVQYLTVEEGQQPQMLSTLASPVYSGTRIQNWVGNAVSETLSFDFRNVDQQVERASVYYTPEAAAAMRGSMAANGVTKTVKENRLVATVTPLSRPVIVDFMIVNGQKTWVVEVPLILTYASSSSSQSSNFLVTVKVKEADPALSPDGLLISGFQAATQSLDL